MGQNCFVDNTENIERVEGREYLRNLGVDGSTILQWILNRKHEML